jgi:hypothetical protein
MMLAPQSKGRKGLQTDFSDLTDAQLIQPIKEEAEMLVTRL